MSMPPREFETETTMSKPPWELDPDMKLLKPSRAEVDLDCGKETTVPKPPLVMDIGFDTDRTMPKASRDEPRVVKDDYAGWEVDILISTKNNDEAEPWTVIEQQDISPDYDWLKFMGQPTKRVDGKVVVEPGWAGWEFKPQVFRVWVNIVRDYLLEYYWSDIEDAAKDHGFQVQLEKGVGVERWYIAAAIRPKDAKNPYVFIKATRFCELLATTNVPPSVAIQILNGDLRHKYLPVGRQLGGLCRKLGIPQAIFIFRYVRFISFSKGLVDTLPGVTLYYTGNTITVVGECGLDLQLEMVALLAVRCIVENEEPENVLESLKGCVYDSTVNKQMDVKRCIVHDEEPEFVLESFKVGTAGLTVNNQKEGSSHEGPLKNKLSKKRLRKKKLVNDEALSQEEPLNKKGSNEKCPGFKREMTMSTLEVTNEKNLRPQSETTMSMPIPRNLVIDRNIGWQELIFVMPEKESDEVNPFLDQESIAPDYDWSKLMPPSEKGLEFKPQYFRIVVYPMRDYLLANHWHAIQRAAEDNGFGIALKMGKIMDVFYITMATLPSSAKDPYAFCKATRFCELLATTNVPPSVAIQILNGDLAHKYLPIGCQLGGFCRKHEIPQATFVQRYRRFIQFIKDRLVSYGVLLYLTGNTITLVGKPQLDGAMEKVIDCAKHCILKGEVFLKKKKKKGSKKGSKNKVGIEETLPHSSATQEEREQDEWVLEWGSNMVSDLCKHCILKDEVLLKKKKKKGSKNKVGIVEALPHSSATQEEREQDEWELEWGGNKVSHENPLPLPTALWC